MGKYTVTHSCGHTEEVALFGPEKDRTSKIQWMSKAPCLACKRAVETERANTATKDLNLPQLIGTEKQITWAQTIRAKLIPEYTAEVNKVAARRISPDNPNAAKGRAMMDGLITAYKAQTAASYWIDRRDRGVDAQVQEDMQAAMRAIAAQA